MQTWPSGSKSCEALLITDRLRELGFQLDAARHRSALNKTAGGNSSLEEGSIASRRNSCPIGAGGDGAYQLKISARRDLELPKTAHSVTPMCPSSRQLRRIDIVERLHEHTDLEIEACHHAARGADYGGGCLKPRGGARTPVAGIQEFFAPPDGAWASPHFALRARCRIGVAPERHRTSWNVARQQRPRRW